MILILCSWKMICFVQIKSFWELSVSIINWRYKLDILIIYILRRHWNNIYLCGISDPTRRGLVFIYSVIAIWCVFDMKLVLWLVCSIIPFYDLDLICLCSFYVFVWNKVSNFFFFNFNFIKIVKPFHPEDNTVSGVSKVIGSYNGFQT